MIELVKAHVSLTRIFLVCYYDVLIKSISTRWSLNVQSRVVSLVFPQHPALFLVHSKQMTHLRPVACFMSPCLVNFRSEYATAWRRKGRPPDFLYQESPSHTRHRYARILITTFQSPATPTGNFANFHNSIPTKLKPRL